MTDYLTKEHQKYYDEQPRLQKDKINEFRNVLLPLYERTLLNDYEAIREATGSLSDIYFKQGYKSNPFYFD